MVFQILISTIIPDPEHFRGLPAPALVISQNGEGKTLADHSLKFLSFSERGLSKSRNHALNQCESEFALISDDDVVYDAKVEEKVVEAFRKYPDAAILTFKIATPEGEPYKKSYSKNSFVHDRTSIYRVSSIEIAIRLNAIREKKVRFDTGFGLGAEFPSGEEVIFLNDALNAGLQIRYIPEVVVFHPLESSGKILDKKFFRSKGAIVRRLYGFRPQLIIGLLFLAKQFVKKNKLVSFADAILESGMGFFSSKRK